MKLSLMVYPETAIPWQAFSTAGFNITFATENGKQPACDERMLSGITGMLLGAATPAKDAYKVLQDAPEFKSPSSWSDPAFTLNGYDLVFLPGGHDKPVRQIIDSKRVHELLVAYFPQTRKPSKKAVAAICHGVQVLAASETPGGKSVLADATTTCLLHIQEESIYQATRLFLGDYYKTYGAGTPSVQEIVKGKLEDAGTQFKSSLGFTP
jgi:putative intracellular protease/amidase